MSKGKYLKYYSTIITTELLQELATNIKENCASVSNFTIWFSRGWWELHFNDI